MSVEIKIGSPLGADARKLIAQSEEVLRSFYSEDECFSFTPEELVAEHIDFYLASIDGEAMGCVALVQKKNYGEIKRLFVSTKARGKGLAKQLMARLEADAKAAGLNSVKLETGEKLVEAVQLYHSLGYSVCGPFGSYEDLPASLFMTKQL